MSSSADLVSILPLGFSKPTHQVSRDEARAMKATGQWYFASSGRELRQVGQRFTPKQSAQRNLLGWKPASSGWRMVALCEGRASCVGGYTDSKGKYKRVKQQGGVANYPIPFAWEGTLGPMHVQDVNG